MIWIHGNPEYPETRSQISLVILSWKARFTSSSLRGILTSRRWRSHWRLSRFLGGVALFLYSITKTGRFQAVEFLPHVELHNTPLGPQDAMKLSGKFGNPSVITTGVSSVIGHVGLLRRSSEPSDIPHYVSGLVDHINNDRIFFWQSSMTALNARFVIQLHDISSQTVQRSPVYRPRWHTIIWGTRFGNRFLDPHSCPIYILEILLI